MKIITLSLSLICISILCAAAQTGSVKGVVKDAQTGEKLPNIEVFLDGNTKVFTLTDQEGAYLLENIPTGFRKILFRGIAYGELRSEPIQITVAKVQTLDVQLTATTTELGEVQVVGRSSRRIENPPIGVYKLNIQQIEKSPGGNRDISKVVQNLPGVAAMPINRNDLIVRGGGPNENKFYLDRIEIPVLNHFQTQGASGGNASLVNSDFLNGATLYTSAFPASRANGLSSVLDLRMKEGNPDKFKVKFSVGASDVALTLDTPLGQKTNLIASYRVSYLQFLFQALKLPFLPTYQDAQFKLSHHFDDRNSLYIIGLGSLDKNRLNLSMNDLPPDRKQILDYLPQNDQWSYVVGAVYNHRTDNGSLDVILSTNKLNNSLQKWIDNNPTNPKSLDYRSNETEVKARVEYNTALGRGYILNGGVSADRGFYDNRTSQLIYIGPTPVNNSYATELALTRYAAYVAVDKVYFKEKLRLNLSLRMDGNSYSAKMNNPLRQLSPRLAASYAFVPHWSVNANVGRYYQEPGYTAMGYRDGQGVNVNRDRLRYIESDQATLGIAFDPNSGQRVSIEAFYKGYSRYPMSLVDSTAIGSNGSDVFAIGAEPVASIGKARAYGFEVMYRNDDLLGCMFNVTYTYYYSQYRKLDSKWQPTGDYIASNWDYRHLFNIMLSRSFKRGWDVGMRWRFAGGAPSTPYDVVKSSQVDVWQSNRRPVLNYSLVNSQRLPSFHQLDLRVDKSWYFKKWTLSLYVDIQNLYNYRAYGREILMPQTDLNGNYIRDPKNPNQYLMESFANEIGGTIIPTFGIIIEL